MTDSKKDLLLRIDSDHILREPPLHDAELKDVLVRRVGDDLDVTLEFSDYQDGVYVFKLEGCIKLDISGIHHQNVVYDVLISSTEHILSDIEQLLLDFDAPQDEKFYSEWIRRDNIGRFTIVPSYGASINIYFKKMSVEKNLIDT